MLRKVLVIAAIGVAGEYLQSRIVGARGQLQHAVLKHVRLWNRD
jgi:hypothetical protein